MEKRISFIQFQSVKQVAKAVEPKIRQKERLETDYNNLDLEYQNKFQELCEKFQAEVAAKKAKMEKDIEDKEQEIAAFEAGVVHITGFRPMDLVQKITRTEANGKKSVHWVPTSCVNYDEATNQYVISTPGEPEEAAEETAAAELPEEQPEPVDMTDAPLPEAPENDAPAASETPDFLF